MNENTEKHVKPRIILNLVITILVIVGVIVMINSKSNATGLTDSGWANLKFYTVLSNIFAGIIALCQLISDIRKKGYLTVLKLTSATAVALTFIVVAGFFGPLYGWLKLYQGSNLFFHLIVPVLCVIEFIICSEGKRITLKHRLIASLSTVVYGLAYLVNILINGVGTWPESNDWYGFLNWGYAAGLIIFAGIIIVSFGIASLLGFVQKKRHKN